MSRWINSLVVALRESCSSIQSILNFEPWREHPQFGRRDTLGRAALLGTILGVLWGFHLAMFFAVTPTSPRGVLLSQWCLYGVCMSSFHLLEFFTTAIYNPSQLSADSFVVNHSTAYTAAALTSWTEFALRLAFVPTWNSQTLSYIGLACTILAQSLRSLAMITAGQSFNHCIQRVRKDTHVLITHGVYSIFRHPSYVGFYYWSISLQLVLGNLLHAVLFAAVAWVFFHRRIRYEEETLLQLFPDTYPAYQQRTYTGIPFLRSYHKSD